MSLTCSCFYRGRERCPFECSQNAPVCSLRNSPSPLKRLPLRPQAGIRSSFVWKEPGSGLSRALPLLRPWTAGVAPVPQREGPRPSPCAGSSLRVHWVLNPCPAERSRWSPVQQPGWQPPQSRASFGVKGRRCFQENADTTLKYSGAPPSAAVIKKGTD